LGSYHPFEVGPRLALRVAGSVALSGDNVSILTMNGDSYRLKQSVGHRRTSARAEQNQATADIVDPDTGEITAACRRADSLAWFYCLGPQGARHFAPLCGRL